MSESNVITGRLEEDGRKKSNNGSSTTAQRRWKILARALTGSDTEDEVSVRRFTRFQLLRTIRLENNGTSGWYEYTATIAGEPRTVLIRHVSRVFTANELIGFNNTGNVCVWPSEECLAYYLLRNRHVCKGKRILELGGGMSCLAGLMAAKYCQPAMVTLTDGNVTSVENVRCILARNCLQGLAECGVVQWARAARAARAFGHQPEANGNRLKTLEGNEALTTTRIIRDRLYDVILCADCLFFDDARLDLVETIHGWLAQDGVALVMAPRRGTTFQRFADAASRRGFIARQIERYDRRVWSRHLELLDRCQEYCPDLHYPLLLELTKQKRTLTG